MDTNTLLEAGLGAAAVAAIIEALKQLGVRTKWLPILTLVVGAGLSVAWGFAQGYNAATIIVDALLFAGVAAHGYDVTKAAVLNISPEQEATALERRLSFLKKDTDTPDAEG